MNKLVGDFNEHYVHTLYTCTVHALCVGDFMFYTLYSTHIVQYEYMNYAHILCICAIENTCFLARFDYAHILCICATENTCFFSEIWLVPRVWLSCSVSNLHKAELQAKCHGQGSDQQPKIKHLALAKMCLEYSTKLYVK